MRIHTDLLEADIREAGRLAKVGFQRLNPKGSRVKARAFDVILSGRGRMGTRYGDNQGMQSATWDEWGVFLGILFAHDSTASAPPYYVNAEHFEWSTDGRFSDGQEVTLCRHMKWDWNGESVTKRYYVQQCAKCGTLKRTLAAGVPWSVIGGVPMEFVKAIAPTRS